MCLGARRVNIQIFETDARDARFNAYKHHNLKRLHLMAEFICVLMCSCMCQLHTPPSQDQIRTVAKDSMRERERDGYRHFNNNIYYIYKMSVKLKIARAKMVGKREEIFIWSMFLSILIFFFSLCMHTTTCALCDSVFVCEFECESVYA